MAASERSEFQYDHARRVLLVCGAMSLAFIPGDLLYPGGRQAILWRSAWVLVLVAASVLQRPARPLAARRALLLAGLTTGTTSGVIVWLSGGSFGPRFGFLLGLGPTALLLLPDQPRVALLAGGAALGAALLVMVRDGRPAAYVFEWFGVALALALLAGYGARWFRTVWMGQIRAERERGLALERLALSERRRIEAERLAAVGRLAGEVAHGIANPLAVVKANLRWLGAERPGDDSEGVLGDTDEGLRRIARILDDIRALAGDGSGPSTFDAAALADQVRKLVAERSPAAELTVDLPPALPAASGSPERLARALAHLVAHLLGTPPRTGPVSLGARREGHELAFLVRTSAAAGPRRGGSLDWSLAAELAAQGNGAVDALREEGMSGYTLRVPVATDATPGTPAPLPLETLASGKRAEA